MSTYVAFSGLSGDGIYVEEDVAAVAAALSPDGPHFGKLTQIPLQSDAFEKGEVLLNASRVAYVRAN